MTREVSIADAKATFSSCVKDAETGDHVIITRRGRPVAAVVSVAELERLRQTEAKEERGGLLGLVGLDEGGEFVEALEATHAGRSQPRTTPDLE